MNPKSYWLMVLVATHALAGAALAQNPKPTGSIPFKGSVVTREHEGVEKASITVVGNGIRRRVRSDREGTFAVALPPGVYQFTIEKRGFAKLLVREFQVGTAAPPDFGYTTGEFTIEPRVRSH